MKQQHIRFSIAAALAAMCAPAAHAVDVTAGDWKLSFDGNVNADYIYSNCESLDKAVDKQGLPLSIGGGLTCVAPGDGQRSSSSVSNGLLPAALSISAATTQAGYDIGVTFGLYPGISTNDGGSPNLGSTTGNRNVALGTAGLDVRQVFLTFGNKEMGTVLAGRNIGLFGADAILNDMTLLGVGANGSNAAPTNTSLGSIGYGYIYTDWLAQINYTTPDLSGFKVTLGIFDPLESLTDGTGPTPKATPGFHGKIAYKPGGALYLSASFIYEKQEFQRSDALGNLITGQKVSYDGTGFDFGGKYDLPMGFQVAAWGYYAKGLGTTGLFINSADTDPTSPGYGENRKSYGALAQVTYKIPETNHKLGVNYGTSRLSRADNEVNPTLVKLNDKVSLGVYDQLTPNLMLLAEGTTMWSKNQVGDENKAWVANVGAFVSF
jgi:predicted porin